MTKQIKWAALVLGFVGIVGGAALFANNSKNYNSILSDSSGPSTVRTSYTGTTAVPPVDFEKAAAEAVPAVVHIKTLTKFKLTGGRDAQKNPYGDMFGDDF